MNTEEGKVADVVPPEEFGGDRGKVSEMVERLSSWKA